VNQRSLDEIDKIYKERQIWLLHMRIPYDKREEILILKFVVNVVHECMQCLDGINKIHEER
jgi:hypothetical protein